MHQPPAAFLRALDDAPIGAAHRRLFAVVGIGLVVDSFDIFIASGIFSALLHEGVATLADLSQLASATAVGLALGALIGGILADRFGRRLIILVGAVLVTIGAFGSIVAPTIHVLIATRSVTAFGLGIENVLAYGILIEFLPQRTRGTWMTALAFVATCAAPLSLIISYYVAPSPGGWRLLFGLVAVLSAAGLLMRFALPESARWLATRGRLDEARTIVMRFAPQLNQAAAAKPADLPATTSSAPARVSLDLVARLGVAALLNVGLAASSFGFLSWLPTFFAAEGRALPSALLAAAAINVGAPIGVLFGLLAADRGERKWTTVIAALAASAAGVAYALAPTTVLLPLGFCVVVAIYAFGALGVSAYMPELFATPIRMRAVGLAISVGRFAAVVIPIVTVSVFQRSGQAGVVWVLAAVLVVVAAAVARFGVRTAAKNLDMI